MSFGILFGSGAAGFVANKGCLGAETDVDWDCHCMVDGRAGETGLLSVPLLPCRPGVPGLVKELFVLGTTFFEVPCLVYRAMTLGSCLIINSYGIV